MVPFAGGVRDAEGIRAFIPVAPDDLVAVDLHDGAILWRANAIGQPIAATASRLVTLVRQPHACVLQILDARDGRPAAPPVEPALPVSDEDFDPRALEFEAMAHPDGLRLQWRHRPRYRGGASPRVRPGAAAPIDAHGALVLDLEHGVARPLPAGETEPTVAAVPRADAARDVSDDPDVVSLDRVGDRRYAVKTESRDGASMVVLEACDATTGAVAWTTRISEQPRGGPAPLRK